LQFPAKSNFIYLSFFTADIEEEADTAKCLFMSRCQNGGKNYKGRNK